MILELIIAIALGLFSTTGAPSGISYIPQQESYDLLPSLSADGRYLSQSGACIFDCNAVISPGGSYVGSAVNEMNNRAWCLMLLSEGVVFPSGYGCRTGNWGAAAQGATCDECLEAGSGHRDGGDKRLADDPRYSRGTPAQYFGH